MRTTIHAVLFAILLLMPKGVMVVRAQEAPAGIVVESPMPYQVFQRQTAQLGYIAVQGSVEGGSNQAFDGVEGCFYGSSPLAQSPAQAKCGRVRYDRATHAFKGMLAVPTGGFYTVELRTMLKKKQVGSQAVEHVGVGEVFVVSGQSNSTNYGEVRQTVKSGFVTTFDGKQWRIADDPQPGTQDNSSKGSFIPAFGDALYARFHVPIGIASVGHGSTSVRQWLPKGGRFKTPPTMTKFTSEVAPGVWECDGTLFDGMMRRIHALDSFAPRGKHGFRALLWHQGESDAQQKPPHEIAGEEYRALMTNVIAASRRDAGWSFPWFVAEASYHTPDDTETPEIRAAQESLWRAGLALEGPDTDQLTGMNRQNNGTGVHMSDMGLQAHGMLWADKVGPWLGSVLSH